jgi:hypothetical protein
MNTRRHNLANILASGILVVVLLSLGLFWMRWFISLEREVLLRQSARRVTLDLSRLAEPARQPDPNEAVYWMIEARMPDSPPTFGGLGIGQYLETRLRPEWPIYGWDPQARAGTCWRYDSVTGQMIYQGQEAFQREDGTSGMRDFSYYAGPEGVAETPDEHLGQFLAPVSDRFSLRPQVLYDRAVRRFFVIDWFRRTVRKGPELPADGGHEPVQIRRVVRGFSRAGLISPLASRKTNQPHKGLLMGSYLANRVLVLDASGRIDLLDPETLTIVGVAGRLESPPPLFGTPRLARPEDVIAYEACPFSLGSSDQDMKIYGGCAVATILRDGTALRLDVYDANGRHIDRNDTRVAKYEMVDRQRIRSPDSLPSGEAAYSYLPGAQLLTVAKFTLENLHPPMLLLSTYLAASHLDARSGYRSIFLLPDSFVAMQARDMDAGVIARPVRAFVFAGPAFLLALLLAVFVGRDGRRLGLSKNARTAWTIGTIVFGLPAYLTYRLTRPCVTLVTCANCGVGRRPDLDRCQHCGSPWVVPELTPPAWRVLGEPEQAEENSFSREPQADSQVQ